MAVMKKLLVFLLLLMLLCGPAHAQDTQAYTAEELLQIWHQVIAMMREAECYPYVELRQGDRGYEVMFLQARLAQLNYYGKVIDPQFGSGTYAAMRMFEQAHDLPSNGIASVEDQQLLFSSKAKFNSGTPAGLKTGTTLPPGGGSWPEGKAPDWWHPMPIIPFLTPDPGQIEPGIEIPELNLSTPKPVITPKPGATFPGIEIPGFDINTSMPIMTSTPGIVPDILNTAFPNVIPDFVFPQL